MRDTIHVAFTVSDDEGQYKDPVILEVRQFSIHGFTEGGLFFDLYHTDGTAERRTLRNGPRYFDPMTLSQSSEQIMSVRIVTFAGVPTTKEEFHARFGVERIRNELGHFAEAK